MSFMSSFCYIFIYSPFILFYFILCCKHTESIRLLPLSFPLSFYLVPCEEQVQLIHSSPIRCWAVNRSSRRDCSENLRRSSDPSNCLHQLRRGVLDPRVRLVQPPCLTMSPLLSTPPLRPDKLSVEVGNVPAPVCPSRAPTNHRYNEPL